MRAKYGEITKDVLLMLAAGAVFAVAATSPNFLINLARVIGKNKKYNKNYNGSREKSLAKSLGGLDKNRIVIINEKDGKFIVRLTEKGKRVIKEIQFDDMRIEKQKVWDGKWRISTFNK